MTFSIVGYDPTNGDLGIAVASKFIAVGAVVPYAKAGVGAVATQAWANTDFGPDGLDRMRGGASATEALAALVDDDHGCEVHGLGRRAHRGARRGPGEHPHGARRRRRGVRGVRDDRGRPLRP